MAFIKKIEEQFHTVGNRINRPLRNVLIIGGLALFALIVILSAIHYWKFTHYTAEISDTSENTLVYTYHSVNGNVLKCASDSAILTNRRNETLWQTEYSMSDARVDSCGELIAIYDKGATRVIVCDKSGQIGTFTTELPIVKIDISQNGTVAALTDDGSRAEINYYDKNGEIIATVKTTMSSDGYPMDLALSDDGLTMAVSFLTFGQGTSASNIIFYDFGADGQSASNNITGSFSYSDEIIADIEYTSGSRFTAFGSEQIIIYKKGRNIEESKIIKLEDDAQSIFANDKCFGYVMQGNNYTGHEIVVYDCAGSEKCRIITDFSYTSIRAYGDSIVMYNRSEIQTYALTGVLKFDGKTDYYIREAQPIGGNRYAVSASDGYYIIRAH